jgi:hypothetical protein
VVCRRSKARGASKRGDISPPLFGVTKDEYHEINYGDPGKTELRAVFGKIVEEVLAADPDDEEESDKLCEERWSVAEALMGHVPQTFADLAYQAEAYLIADLDLLEDASSGTSDWLIRTLFHNVRTLGAIPQSNDPSGVSSLDLSREAAVQS